MTRGRNGLNTMKTILFAAAAAALVLCFAACGNTEESTSPENSQTAETSASPTVTGTPAPQTVSVKMATVNEITGTLNIRSEPNTTCTVLGSASAGDKFEVLTENCQEGWHEISYNNGKAYISAEFVTVAEEVQTAPTPTPDPNAPIIVNGSGREEISRAPSDERLTVDSINETEDPERR